jgi:hypothetical protein
MSIQLTAQEAGGWSAEYLDPVERELFRSFMLALRRTVATGDKANFLRVANAVARISPAERDEVSQLRRAYLKTMRRSGGALTALGEVTAEDVLQAWLYGFAFHDDDPDQRAKWNELTSDGLRAVLAQAVVEATAMTIAEHVLTLDRTVTRLLQPASSPAEE